MGSADHLARVMEERRLDLDLEWNDVAAAARISPANLRSIRSGKTRPTPLTTRRIEKVFQWEAGSFDAVQAGGQPTVAPEDAGREPSLTEVIERMTALAEEVKELRQRDEERERQIAEEIERLRRQQSG